MHPQPNNSSSTDLLHTLVLAIADTDSLQAALDSIIQETCSFTGWEYAEAWIVEPVAGAAKSRLLYFENQAAKPAFVELAEQRKNAVPVTSDVAFEQAWARRLNVFTESLSDPTNQTRLLHWADARSSGLSYVFAVPLVYEEKRIVTVAFFWSQPHNGGTSAVAMNVFLQNRSLLGDLLKRKSVVADLNGDRPEVDRKYIEEARQAQSIAEEANKAKSEFLSRMSHELRTPLNSIIGFADLLNMEGLEPRQRENLGYIRQAGRHLLQLVNEVLDITSLESGAISFSLEPVRLTDLLNEAIDLVKPQAAARGVSLDTDLPQTDLYMKADRQRMKQVLLNLLSNAIKYNVEHGSVTIRVLPSSKERVRIEVEDTGIGIDPELIGKLYMPFERLGAERIGAEGTGLGLALTKRLVEAMYGLIGAESTQGQGSTFWVEMPVTKMPTVSTRDLATLPISSAQIPDQTATILYVEDNLSNIRLVERILEHRQGIRLISCMQGRLALEISRDHKPDIILLDIHLPDMTGQAVLESLKEDSATRSIPVVIISADASAGTLERLMQAGAAGYLTKPIEVRRFLRLLDDTLSTQ